MVVMVMWALVSGGATMVDGEWRSGADLVMTATRPSLGGQAA